MDPILQELLERSQAGASVGEILALLQQTLPRGERELLRRCALVRQFDEGLVEEVLRPSIPADVPDVPSFAELIQQSAVEPVGPAGAKEPIDGTYRLWSGARRDHLESWMQEWDESSPAFVAVIPRTVRALGRAIAGYWEQPGRTREPEALHALLLGDPEAGAQRFRRLYEEADARADLAACADLLRILEDWDWLPGRELKALREEHEFYFRMRTGRLNDFYQTAFYYERAPLRAACERLLADGEPWILHLHAPGGSGKTMFVRWLMARHCAAAPQRIPSARLDFHNVNLARTVEDPRILLEQWAMELNEQLPNRPFGNFLAHLRESFERGDRESAVFHRAYSLESFESSSGGSTLAEDSADAIWSAFAYILQDALPGRKCLLVLDTLEQLVLVTQTREGPVLQRQRELMDLLKRLAAVHDRFPGFRLVLSGRYPLTERLKGGDETPSYEARFGSATVTYSLEGFSDDEARGYLTEKRRMLPGPVLEAVVAKARSKPEEKASPFKLALLADVVRGNPHLTAGEIAQYEDADLAYLIERVIRQIKQPAVRWLLRYGVIPRRLTFSFLEEVMQPFLRQAMSGRTREDDPEKDSRHFPSPAGDEGPVGRDASVPVQDLYLEDGRPILASPGAPLDLQELWQSLRSYASEYSWVSVPANDPTTLDFHPEVLHPMRRLLQKHAIYRRLHRTAIRYWEKRAREEAADWGVCTREAIYHQFQLRGLQAGTYWRRQLAQAEARCELAWLRDVAREITGDEYLEEGEPRRQSSGAPIVSERDLILAHYTLACAGLKLARSTAAGAQDALWTEIESALAQAELLQRRQRRRVIDERSLVLARATLLLQRHRYAEAQMAIDGVLGTQPRRPRKDGLSIRLLLLRGDAQAYQGAGYAALTSYQQALDTVSGLPETEPWDALRLEIRQKLARQFLDRDLLGQAAAICRTGLDACLDSGPAAVDLVLLLGECYLRSGLPSAVVELALHWSARTSEELEFAALQLLAARGLLLARRTEAAAERCEAVLYRLGARVEAPPDTRRPTRSREELLATALEVNSECLAELMEFDRALDALEQARVAWHRIGSTAGALRTLLTAIQVRMRDLGDLRDVESHLREAMAAEPQRGTESWARLEMLRLTYLSRTHQQPEAEALLDWLLSRVTAEWAPRIGATLAAGALAHSVGERGRLLELLRAALARVEPPRARLLLLDSLASAPALELPGTEAHALLELLEVPVQGDPDLVPLALKLAQVRAVVGLQQEARVLARYVEAGIARDDSYRFALRELLLLRDRIGWQPKELQEATDQVGTLTRACTRYPVFCGVVLVEHAERLLKAEMHRGAEGLVGDAARHLDTTRLPSRWPARLETVRAQLARARGAGSQLAQHLDKATTILRSLNDVAALAGLTAWVETRGTIPASKGRTAPNTRPADRPAIPESTLGPRTVLLQLRRTPEAGLSAHVFMSEGMAYRMDGDTLRERLPDALLFAPGDPDWFAASPEHFQFLRRWPEVGTQLGGVLGVRGWDRFAGRQRRSVDLRLDIEPALAALPWELMRPPWERDEAPERPSWRYVYRSARTQARIPLPSIPRGGRPQVLLLRPVKMDPHDRAQSGRDSFEALESAYRSAGFEVTAFHAPQMEQIAYHLQSMKEPPHVLHACGTLRHSPSLGGAYLDCASWGNRDPEFQEAPLSASGWKRLLHAAPRPIPLLVLDALPPASNTEAFRQLLLRNSLAHEVFPGSPVGAILGTGLTPPLRTRELERAFTGPLAVGYPIGEIVENLRLRLSEDPYGDPDAAILGLSLALWTSHPEVSLMGSREETV